MTTAARPTFEPARGGTGRAETDLGALSKQYSSRDLPSHTKLKYRQEGQSSSGDLKGRNFRRELESREHAARERRGDREFASSAPKRSRTDTYQANNVDADDPIENYDDDDDDDDDDDGDDEEAAVMAELMKIKREREAEAMAKEAEKKAEEERIRTDNIIRGNPLLNPDRSAVGSSGSKDFKVKRRWDDDVVFKNCARVEDDKAHSEFINDTLRSEFHKKFMSKYIK